MQLYSRIVVNLLVILVKILVNLLVILVIPVELTRMNPMGAMGGLPYASSSASWVGEYTWERLVRSWSP